MNCKNILFLSVMYILLPIWIGYLWVEFIKIEGRINRILHAWILGFVTMLAVAQLILVPLVALQKTLTTAIIIWNIVMHILAIASFVVWLGHFAAGKVPGKEVWDEQQAPESCDGRAEKACAKQQAEACGEQKGQRRWIYIFGLLTAMLVLIQAYIPARYEHSDDDDARFIAEQVSAVDHDMMYQDSPIHADYLYWNEGEVRKDLTSPWAMLMAITAKESGMAPAELSHSYLPFFLILICYVLYLMIGRKLFKGDWEKTFLFLIILSVVHLAGYTSTHTLASMLLLRIWQGKAVCASFMLPLFFYLFYQIMQKDYNRRWLPVLYFASTGACLLSGIGIVTAPIMLFLYGGLDFIYYRNWRKTFTIWMAALPCGIFLGYYLM